MRTLIAPFEFKGTLTAAEAAAAIAEGVTGERELVPLADGGPGTLDALLSTGGERREARVKDPLGREVRAAWGLKGTTALVEMAQASGLWRVAPHERDVLRASTEGTGQLIRAAIDAGATTVIVALGGSATVDGGVGALSALGIQIPEGVPSATAAAAGAVGDRRESTERQRHPPAASAGTLGPAQLIIAVDVNAPLVGPLGAAQLFGPQKGASAEQVDALERRLLDLATRAPHLDPTAPGMGAAGGLAFGLCAWAGARIVSGFDLLAQALDLEARVAAADLVITGEGRLDAQSALGKGPLALAALAQHHRKRVVAIVGSVSADAPAHRFDQVLVAPGTNRDTAWRALAAAARRLDLLAPGQN